MAAEDLALVWRAVDIAFRQKSVGIGDRNRTPPVSDDLNISQQPKESEEMLLDHRVASKIE